MTPHAGYTVTPSENGGVVVSETRHSGGQTVAWTPNDVTGEPEYWNGGDNWYGNEAADEGDYDRYADEEPNINNTTGIAALNPNATEAQVAQYWLSGKASDAEIQQIVNSIDETDPRAVDRVSHLLAFKNGDLSLAEFAQLEPEAYGELAPFINGTSSYTVEEADAAVDEIISELSEETQRILNEKVDPAELSDLKETAGELLGAEPEPQYIEASSQKAEEAYAVGDGEAALLWSLNANFNAGSMSAKECIATAVKHLGVTGAYNKFLELTQGDPDGLQFGYSTNDTNDYEY